MRLRVHVLLFAAALVPLAAQAQTGSPAVKFSQINDAVAGRFFDSTTTLPDPLNPNVLVVGLHTGIDPLTWKDRDFKASLTAFSFPAAIDTLSFVIEAP